MSQTHSLLTMYSKKCYSFCRYTLNPFPCPVLLYPVDSCPPFQVCLYYSSKQIFSIWKYFSISIFPKHPVLFLFTYVTVCINNCSLCQFSKKAKTPWGPELCLPCSGMHVRNVDIYLTMFNQGESILIIHCFLAQTYIKIHILNNADEQCSPLYKDV